MKYTKFLTIILASLFAFSCTKLDEELRDSLNAEAVALAAEAVALEAALVALVLASLALVVAVEA